MVYDISSIKNDDIQIRLVQSQRFIEIECQSSQNESYCCCETIPNANFSSTFLVIDEQAKIAHLKTQNIIFFYKNIH